VSRKAIDSIAWATVTGVLGDAMSGIWPKYSDRTGVRLCVCVCAYIYIYICICVCISVRVCVCV